MFATIRRYNGVDQNRAGKLIHKVNETLHPKLEKLAEFSGGAMSPKSRQMILSYGRAEPLHPKLEKLPEFSGGAMSPKIRRLILSYGRADSQGRREAHAYARSAETEPNPRASSRPAHAAVLAGTRAP